MFLSITTCVLACFVPVASGDRDCLRADIRFSCVPASRCFFQAVKPASSRSQSAEIFVVGRNYKAPDFIDSRMFDPKHAFRQDYEAEGWFSVTRLDCLALC